MKQSLSLSLSQQLTLTPQLKQSLKLLQLSAFDLEREVQAELEANPLLERVDVEDHFSEQTPEHTPLRDNNIPQPITEASEPDAELARTDNLAPEQDLDSNWQEHFAHVGNAELSSNALSSEFDLNQLAHTSETLVEHLLWQLQMTALSEQDQFIGRVIIRNLDDAGYLTTSTTEISKQFEPSLEITVDEVQAVLSLIKTFEPLGVGADSLGERLAILVKQHYSESPDFDLAQQIVEHHLEALAAHQYAKLQKELKIDQQRLARVVDMITSVKPRIALEYDSDKQDQIIPDLIASKNGSRWEVKLNPDNQIHLRVNDLYASLVKKQARGKLASDDTQYIDEHTAQAKVFIKGLMSRYDTLLLVGKTIVERQQGFFLDGEQSMQAMILQDIASALDLHESTISRATAGKYLLCPSGVYELKYFFSSALSNKEGTSSSSTAIRSLIKKMVDAESKTKPLSDNKIAKQLEEMGHIVARRTVAKYRESLDIAPSSRRKSLQ